MASPSLLAQQQRPYEGEKVHDEWCQAVYQKNLDWLCELDSDPAPLEQWLQQNESPLLGVYFEFLIAFWLQHLAETTLLARNLVVGEPGIRVGEFDLLFESEATIFHWEVSVKFYLRYGDDNYQWLGPNPRDSLHGKLTKVFNRQLKLGDNPRAKKTLMAKIGGSEIKPQAFIKGYLFYPYDCNWQQPDQIPAGISDRHLKGWWCYWNDISTLLGTKSDKVRWCVLSRLEWLAPVNCASEQMLFDASSLKGYLNQYFSSHYKALLVVELVESESCWQERSRGFIVDNAWPAMTN